MKNMELTVLGGAREIGANCYYLKLHGQRPSGTDTRGILLDAGLHPKKQGTAALPNFAAVPGDVDEILISHAHLDHVGALPMALKHFPRSRVYMTGPSSLLALRMLRNAVAVSSFRSAGRIANRRALRLNSLEASPLYSYDHVEWVEQVALTHEPGQTFTLANVAGEEPKVTFFSSGHVLGAVGILLEYGGRRLFYTGDTCATGQHLIGPARYPRSGVDILLMESTHGADIESDLARDRKSFHRAIAELGAFISSVAERGGSVLIPVFALGRTQEILGILQSLMRRALIPTLPIFISGLAHGICRIYDATRLTSDRLHSGLRLEDIGYRLLDPDKWDDPTLLKQPCILAVSSGMMFEGTTSHSLACRILPEAKHGLALVGFLDPESPGYRVANTAWGETVDLGGEIGPVRVACTVRRFSFTAHSRASQLLQTVKDLHPAQVILVHGDDAAARGLSTKIADFDGVRVTVASAGETICL
jgi:Cft2 family RNA processing exonuclease